MQALPFIHIAHLGLYLQKHRALVISDLHLGFEEELATRGILVPRFHFKDVLEQSSRTIDAAKLLGPVEKIIINGDLKHEFGVISPQEWREILKLLDFLSKHCKTIVLIKGNHDIKLAPIARKRQIEVVSDLLLGSIFITHGHVVADSESFKKAKVVIIGNEHPAISIKDTIRSETFKCFLSGTFKRKKLLVIPSMNPSTIGTDVRSGEFISPYLHQDISKFRVYIVGDVTYDFGVLSKL